MNTLAMAMGGHCRVGIEDNIYHDFGRQDLAANDGLVARLRQLTCTFGRPFATPARARTMLGLGPAPGAEPAP